MWFALSLTLLAGLSTAIGGLLALHRRVLERDILAVALGFSAGAMLYVSFTEILGKSHLAFAESYDAASASWLMIGSFFGGVLVVALIDRVIPKGINPSKQEGREVQKDSRMTKRDAKLLMRSGLLVAIALSLHNFPEGFATFMAALEDPSLGIALVAAIAIHNIPEGIAVAAPIYAATGSRLKAFFYTSLSGLAEPIGALAGYLLLRNHLTDTLFGVVFGAVAGMMVFIALDELLPAAKRYETNQHQTIYGCLAGMLVIATSLVLFL